jgi:hypothetical protein
MKICTMKAGLVAMLAVGLSACTDVPSDGADPLLARIEALEVQQAAAHRRIEANTALAGARGEALQPAEVSEALTAQLTEHGARLAEVEAFAQAGASRDWVLSRGFASYDALEGLEAYAQTVANLGIARSARLDAQQLRLDALDAAGQQTNVRLGALESAQNNAGPAFGPELAALTFAVGPEGELQTQLTELGERVDGNDEQFEAIGTQLDALDGRLNALPMAQISGSISTLEETLATTRTSLVEVQRVASGASHVANTATNSLNAQRGTIDWLRTTLVEYMADHRDEYLALDAAMGGVTQSIGVHQENLANVGQALDAQQQDLGALRRLQDAQAVALDGLDDMVGQMFGSIDTLGRDAVTLAETVNTQTSLLTRQVQRLETDKQPASPALTHLLRYLRVDTAHNVITFAGANIHIRHRNAGHGHEANGLGNLLIGASGDGTHDISGSHNLVIGHNHAYGAQYGVVTGIRNEISANYAAILGGRENRVDEPHAVIIGGIGNTASGMHSAIVAGESNTTTAWNSAVIGGESNTASGYNSAVTGGEGSIAVGERSTISGGLDNVTLGEHAWVGGGRLNNASGARSAVLGGAEHEADHAEQALVGQ